MTNSDTSIREFAENLASYCSTLAFMTEGDVKQLADSFHKPLTALISEHYVAKEEVDKMASERLREELVRFWVYQNAIGAGDDIYLFIETYLRERE